MIYLLPALEILMVIHEMGRFGALLLASSGGALTLMYFLAGSRKIGKRMIPVDREEMKWLHDGITRLSKRAKIKPPKVYLLDDYIPNAYSFGNNIVLSLGLFEVLDEEGILAVAAHELGHIKNRDTRLFPIVMYLRFLMMTLTGAVLLLGSPLAKVSSLLLYIAYEVERSKFMKKREFKADRTALKILDVPLSLKRALEELKYYEDLRASVKVNGIPSIEPGIDRDEKTRSRLIDTHPSYEERIARILMYSNILNFQIK